ncbi:hypothetical protein LQ567_15005 [Niabella pedocola]|uniref:DUF4397 domain-containing protein n=1 Tax=Niabella pedocola TaxID=1752077 RepID=A0ABS8PW11_9BACT|nr:hypothetical protein [Niabella pedocola]MCD2424086.1 hypothetical protein [Niabella pedocola]
MWKNRMIRSCWLILFLWSSVAGHAQNGQLTINETALIDGSVSMTASGYNYNPGILALLPNIMVKGNGDLNPVSGTNSALPLSKFTAMYVRGANHDNAITLSTTTAQSMTSELLSLLLLSGGPFTVKYEAPGLSATAWKAGTYSNTLAFSLSAIGIGSAVTPTQATLTVTVDPLITASSAPGNMALVVNDLKYFRNTTLEINNAFTLRHTVPVQLTLAANTAQLAFANGYSGVADPQTGVGKIQLQMTTPAGSILPLTTTSQQLVANAPVPVGNKTNFTTRFFISPSDLKTAFINKGDYSTTLTLQGTNTSPAATYSKVLNLVVTVNDLSEFNLSATGVTLPFQTAADYKNGVALDLTNHLQVSKTTPYDISVKAQTSDLTNGASGATVPVNILELGPVAGQSGVNTISALSTTDQLLVSGALPAVDRYLNIRYRIPPSRTQYLINKPAGIYTAVINYTLTAH